MLQRVGGRVLLDISEDDYELLLFALGIATGLARENGTRSRRVRELIRLTDRINEGNPDYKPYHLDPEQGKNPC